MYYNVIYGRHVNELIDANSEKSAISHVIRELQNTLKTYAEIWLDGKWKYKLCLTGNRIDVTNIHS